MKERSAASLPQQGAPDETVSIQFVNSVDFNNVRHAASNTVDPGGEKSFPARSLQAAARGR
jgi:hypothetical protein